MRIIFDCEFADKPAELVFELQQHEEGAVQSEIRLTGPDTELKVPCFFQGSELSDFTKDLIDLQAGERDDAHLLSFDEHVDLRFVRDPESDRITINGQLRHPAPFTGNDSGYVPIREGLEVVHEAAETGADRFPSGISVGLGGFVLDPRGLARTLRWLCKFLQDAGIAVENPWLRAGTRSGSTT
ncbi:MAG: hypothetical protein R3336_01550 [Phycisphaeraceae bacterium]|nr:hypothetical protein [Phycisphaeraceae bacterium]